jgi:catechol 2,3-dioxygenase-like lactoylglutathione lyase family enzyme
MDVLSGRVLLHPTDPERSRAFYRDTLGLAVYREFGGGPERGMVFFCAAAADDPRQERRRRVR